MTLEERNKIVLDNQRLVHYVLQKYCRINPSNQNYEELFQEGIVGLIKAVDRFDPDKGFKLATYASSMIYGEVRRYRRDCLSPQGIVVPRSLKDKIFKAISEDQDISSWSMYEQNAYLILTGQISSLDYQIENNKDNSSASISELIADELSYNTYEEQELEDVLEAFLDFIKDDLHYDLIEEVLYDRLFSGDHKTSGQDLIAKKYNMSQAQVSRIICRTGKKFKEFISK